MPEIKLLNSFELVPVIELEPGHFSTTERYSPSGSGQQVPENWTRYWLDSLSDSGIVGLSPLRPGSWHVATSEFKNPHLLAKVLNVVFTQWGGIQGLTEPDFNGVLSGGLALRDADGSILLEPQCCSDLNNLDDWRSAATYKGSEWQMLWVGHPYPSVRFDQRLILSELHESEAPIASFSIDPADLNRAIDSAIVEQKRFSSQIAAALSAMDFQGDARLIADGLAGLLGDTGTA